MERDSIRVTSRLWRPPAPAAPKAEAPPATATKSYINLSPEERQKLDSEFIQLFRLVATLLEVAKDVQIMGTFLNFVGYSNVLLPSGAFEDKLERVEELSYLFNIYLHRRMKEVPAPTTSDENVSKKLTPVLKLINDNPSTTELGVSIARACISEPLQKQLNYVSRLRVPTEEFVKYANKMQVISKYSPPALVKNAVAKMLGNFVKSVAHQDPAAFTTISELFGRTLKGEAVLASVVKNQYLCSGLLLLTASWSSELALGDKVRSPVTCQEFKIVSTPAVSGRRHMMGINEREPKGLTKLDFKGLEDNDCVPFAFELVSTSIADLVAQLTRLIDRTRPGLGDPSNEVNFQDRLNLVLLLQLYFDLFARGQLAANPAIRDRLLADFEDTLVDTEQARRDFKLTLERVADGCEQVPFVVPEEFCVGSELHAFEIQAHKASSHEEENQSKQRKLFDASNLRPPRSTYAVGIPAGTTRSSDFRMLKHWERQIIPKILNFVKGSLSSYEIEDFFEQMRIELRKDNHASASNIAYILCDQKLPNDCLLPEHNYDWNSLSLDEIRVGQMVSVSIRDERGVFSQLFEPYVKLGVLSILGVVILKDPLNSAVCVLVRDLHQINLFSVWVPQQAIRAIEVALPAPASAFPAAGLQRRARESFERLYKVMVRDFFLKEFQLDYQLTAFGPDPRLLRLFLKFQLKGSCLSEWQRINGNALTLACEKPALASFVDKLTQEGRVSDLVDHLEPDIKALLEFMAQHHHSFNMTQRLENNAATSRKAGMRPDRPCPLNIFSAKEETSGLVVEFCSSSNLFKCSGVRFYADPEGVTLVEHLHASQKNSVKAIYPLVFDVPNVFFQFYFNSDALPMAMKNITTTSLDCAVFAIPFSWNYILWCLDTAGTAAVVSNDHALLAKVYRLAAQLFVDFSGPNLCLQQLLNLMSRLVIKLRAQLRRMKADDPAKVDLLKVVAGSPIGLSRLLKDFESQQASTADQLCSGLLQDLTEFLAVYITLAADHFAGSTIDAGQLKELLSVENRVMLEIRQLLVLAELIAGQFGGEPAGLESKEARALLKKKLSPRAFFSNFVVINSLPRLSDAVVKKAILEAAAESRMKLLMPELDVYVPSDSEDMSVGSAIVLFDGWEFQDPASLKPAETPAAPEPVIQEERLWECEVCTLLNTDSSDLCIACESPKPEHPVYPNELKAEEAEPVGQADEESPLSARARLQRFKDAFLSILNRLTPDRRTEMQTFEDKSTDDLRNSCEVLEFLLFRLTAPAFQSRLEEVAKEMAQSEGCESAVVRDRLLSMEPIDLLEELAQNGFDAWLEKVGLSEKTCEPPRLLGSRDVARFLEFLEHDLCGESDEALAFSHSDFRLEFKTEMLGLDVYASGTADRLRYRESRQFALTLLRLNSFSNLAFRTTIAAVREFNILLRKHYKLFNILSPVSRRLIDSGPAECLSVGSLISNLREVWYSALKNFVCNDLLSSTALPRDEPPKVSIERLTREREIMGERRPGSTSEDRSLVFMQAFKQLSEISSGLLRPLKPKGTDSFICFTVVFKGEHVMGEAGPYRQFFSDISGELQPSQLQDSPMEERRLELLIPSPNRTHQLGDARDKFVINPVLKSSHYLSLYEFLGLLMGCAFRTGTFLTVDLPALFWKKLARQTILEEDLEEVDRGIVEILRFFRDGVQLPDDETFQTFTILLSDGSLVELVPNGQNVRVDASNKKLFIEKLLETRIGEADIQIEAIRRGIIKIVPEVLLNCLNAGDLERRICGRNQVDLQLLRSHTIYSGGLTEDSKLVREFWEVLNGLSDNDKLRFVKFCWGQERLPSTSQGFEAANIRFMVKPSQFTSPQDGLLPRADTCFFNFELPNYSSIEIMRERILLAIHTDSDSMNAERALSDNQGFEQEGDNYTVSHYSDNE